MTWLRMDDGFAANKKVVQLTDKQFRVWVRTLCYCAAQQDPTIDKYTMGEVKGLTGAVLLRLEHLELVDREGKDWVVHDWLKYQPKDATGSERQAAWRARRDRYSTVTETVTPTVTESSLAHAVPSSPDQNILHLQEQVVSPTQILKDMDVAS